MFNGTSKARLPLPYSQIIMYFIRLYTTIVSHKNRNYSRCTTAQINRYRDKISGPLLDRIDLHINVASMPIENIQSQANGEKSLPVRKRVIHNREVQINRQGKCNAHIHGKELERFCSLDMNERSMLANAMHQLNLSARAYDRILRVSRTIADMDMSEKIHTKHIAEALSYRNLDRVSEQEAMTM